VQGNGANQEYQIKKTPVGGSCDGDEGGKGAQESTAWINTREKTSWKAQRERLDTVDRDAKRMLKCRNWRRLAEDRDACRRRIKGAKAQFGPYRHRIRRRSSYPHILYFCMWSNIGASHSRIHHL